MAAGRKQIAFDLDTKALEKYYPSESWNNAYDVIKRHMLSSGFSWLHYLRIRAYKIYKDADGKKKKVYGAWSVINKITK